MMNPPQGESESKTFPFSFLLSSRMANQDKSNVHAQIEHLQAKYVGTGHADTTKFEWVSNQKRDSYASYVGHYPMLAYFAVAENEATGRVRHKLLQQMISPCGPPPKRLEDE